MTVSALISLGIVVATIWLTRRCYRVIQRAERQQDTTHRALSMELDRARHHGDIAAADQIEARIRDHVNA